MRSLFVLTFLWLAVAFAYNPADYDRLLQTYVNEAGLVDYESWTVNTADLASLQTFVDDMAAYDPGGLGAAETLAFWINAYNALVINEVLKVYPTGSIRPSFLGIPDLSFFKDKKHVVNGKTYSLDEIENNEIRTLGEPRIHFAINCASHSCPQLLDAAYKAEGLDAQLDAQAVQFINDASRNNFDTSTDTASLSKIFDWFKGDFDAVGGVPAYLVQFARGDAKKVLESDTLTIEYLNYDWGLNSQ